MGPSSARAPPSSLTPRARRRHRPTRPTCTPTLRARRLSFAEFCELQNFLQQLQQTFSAHDGARANQLNLQQIQQAIGAMGFALDMQPDGAFYKLCQAYDFEKRGVIGLDAFIAMVITLKNGRKCFDLFDPQGTGKVTMDFNQYIWTVAQL